MRNLCIAASCEIYENNNFDHVPIKQRIPFCNGNCPNGWSRTELGWVDFSNNKKRADEIFEKFSGQDRTIFVTAVSTDVIHKGDDNTKEGKTDRLVLDFLSDVKKVVTIQEMQIKLPIDPEELSKCLRRLKKANSVCVIKKYGLNYYKIV